jgi:hypothetical protein
MIKKTFVFCACIAFSVWIMVCNIAVAGTPRSQTTWRAVDTSMSSLLDSGWKIIGYSSHRVVIAPYTQGASDEATYSYVLQKNSKYINCFIGNPSPDSAYSGCRQLN